MNLQGDTWIYDRAWWCPGNLQPADIVDIYSSKGTHSLGIKMEPYTATENIQANESIASYLIQYSKPKAKHDIALEQIIVPSDDQNYRKMNPAVLHPIIVIRNLGKEKIKNILIEYGTTGFTKNTFTWKGELDFNKTATIVLPSKIDFSQGQNKFVASINLNGKKDAWEKDNSLTTNFQSPPLLPEKMILQFLTNNKPGENEIKIMDQSGKVVFNKKPESLQPKTMYYDTLSLVKSTYTLALTDTTGDGLEFWYEPEPGYDYLRLLSMDGRLIHNFESDCGDGEMYCFSTSPEVKIDTTQTQYAFVLYPRRTSGIINLEIHADKAGTMDVIIASDGRVVEKHYYSSIKQNRVTYDLSYLKGGRYIIEVLMNGQSQFKRRFNKD